MQSHTFQIDTTFLVVVNTRPSFVSIFRESSRPQQSESPAKKAEALNNKEKLEEVEVDPRIGRGFEKIPQRKSALGDEELLEVFGFQEK
ncbi:MAG: hypothetical protein IPJ00_16505 [Saprospirales bacterium]|nr:hypothetical protein [Saprospirales bacterium]